jgi:hypothetical protein
MLSAPLGWAEEQLPAPAVNFAYAKVLGTGCYEVGERRFSIRYSHQIGVTLGIDWPISVRGMELERVGAGYQFDDGLDALRFNPGFPF